MTKQSASEIFEVIMDLWKSISPDLLAAKSMTKARPAQALQVARKLSVMLRNLKMILYDTKNDLNDDQRQVLASLEVKAQRFVKILPEVES